MARRTSSTVSTKGAPQAIITESGRIVLMEDMKKYEMPVSKQLDQQMFSYGEAIDPPYDLVKLMNWMNVNVVHSSCVRTKVHDAFGVGFYVEPEKQEDEENFQENATYKQLMDFFKRVNANEDIISLLYKVGIDFEGCGNSYIEVSRGKDGNVNGLYHVNACTIKWGKTKDKLVQQVGNKFVWFKLFGDERILNRKTGNFVQSLANLDDIANEIIPIHQYSWESAIYGLPDWLPALYQMYGDMKETEYNIDFFNNFGVPAYALVMEGTTWSEEVKDEIVRYFQTQLKGAMNKTLILSSPEGATLRFERLSVEEKEASFRMYRKDNRDGLLTAHRVPPYRAAIVEQGQLGGNVATETDRIYLSSVIDPKQRQVAWLINELIIKQGLKIEGWEFGFDDIQIQNRDQDSQIFSRYLGLGVMTPNEVRKELGLEPYEGGDLFYQSGMLTATGSTQEGWEAETPPPATPETTPVEGEQPLEGTPQIEDNEEGLTAAQKRGEAEIDLPKKKKK